MSYKSTLINGSSGSQAQWNRITKFTYCLIGIIKAGPLVLFTFVCVATYAGVIFYDVSCPLVMELLQPSFLSQT